MVSKTILGLMSSWLEENPYSWYGSYNDQLSSEQIDFIVDGNFDAFWESWNQHIWDIEPYADLSCLRDEFADEFDLGRNKKSWPKKVRKLFKRNVCYDASEMLDTCIRNTRTRIAVKPVKQSGNQVEFPNQYFPADYTRYLNRYNKKYLGIENSYDAETLYTFDVLTLIGTIDIAEWLKRGRKPDFVMVNGDGFALTHNFHNGSGGLGDVDIGVNKKMRAEFRNDENDRYGVQSVFGFIGEVWKNPIECIWTGA